MKVKELIEWLEKLNPEWDIILQDPEEDDKEITGIEPHEANREYMIY